MTSIKKQNSNSDDSLAHYDKFTIVLHWLTFVLVIVLFLLAQTWGFLEHGTLLRKQLQFLHISFGIVLSAVIVIRLVWRSVIGRHLPVSAQGWKAWAEKLMHCSLYLLLMTQIVTGFLFRWAQAESFMFFGLISVRFGTDKNIALDHTFGDIHNFTAWAIIILALLHSTAALLHHFILKDAVLRRMLPRRWMDL